MRKIVTVTLAALALGTVFASAPAVAYDRTQGGVIPCSRDDYRFDQRRGYVSNCRGGHGGVQRGGMQQGRGMNRGGMQQGNARATQVKMFEYHRRTVTTSCLYKQDWVIRNGVKIDLGRRPC